MKRMLAWITLVMAVGLVAGTAIGQEIEADRAEKAIRKADPDQVDPNKIKGEDYTLDFIFRKPEPIVVTTSENEKKVYWYMLYTVTNNTDEERAFAPAFTLVTDKYKTYRAGVHPKAFEAIKKNRRVRFLTDTAKMHGKLLIGEDNAKTGIAIFPPIDRRTDAFKVFVGNLSGRYIEREVPAPEGAEVETKKVNLHRTLELGYKLRGDKWWLNLDTPKQTGRRWTWR